ncbi:MAG: hypothetical protein IID46_04340 [Planctomycetes bacterium]|nr:hypothetical protein [Planctomycetota bacterium]
MTMWVFEKLVGAAVRRDPNETQLFKTEQAEEGEYAGTDALVREILQNSMDASTGDGPVRLRLALHSSDELPDKVRLGHYFGRLKSPLVHREVEFDADGVPKLNDGFLVCEDFGTRGLGGDPLLKGDPVSGSSEHQDFFWFWRNIGRSGKTGDELGRWGLGKTVYRAASQVGCMLGLTVREEDSRELLMGQAVLKIHEHEGAEYLPEGYWCSGVNDDGLPLPIEDSDELTRFRSEWKLTRKSDQPGLSVVVPYVASELKGRRLLQAICVHFFLPIIRGKLIVDLITPDPDIREVHLDSDSLADWCHGMVWDGPKRTKRHVSPPITFVKRCLAIRENAVATNLLGQTKLPELNDESFEPTTLASLRDDFASEKLIPVKVRMTLPKRDGADEEGELIVFVQRQPDGERADTYYVREGMTITKLNSSARLRGVHAFVLVDKSRTGTEEQNPLASLLGDSEGPAHENWDTSEERPNRLWTKWKGRVKFCRRIVDNLVEVLSPPSNAADFELLSDFFSIEKTQTPERSRAPDPNGSGRPDFGSITPKSRWYRLDGRRGGFRIVSTNDENVPANAQLKVSVAYDIPSGNPLKKWSPFDFDFGNQGSITLEGKKVSVKRLAGNVVLLDIQGKNFSFGAAGFDEHRDVLVRIDEVNGTQEVETEES